MAVDAGTYEEPGPHDPEAAIGITDSRGTRQAVLEALANASRGGPRTAPEDSRNPAPSHVAIDTVRGPVVLVVG